MRRRGDAVAGGGRVGLRPRRTAGCSVPASPRQGVSLGGSVLALGCGTLGVDA